MYGVSGDGHQLVDSKHSVVNFLNGTIGAASVVASAAEGFYLFVIGCAPQRESPSCLWYACKMRAFGKALVALLLEAPTKSPLPGYRGEGYPRGNVFSRPSPRWWVPVC